MRSNTTSSILPGILSIVFGCGVVCLMLNVSHAQAQTKPRPVAQKTFDSPQQAADALIQAAERDDVAALLEIFGLAGKDIVASGDAVEDKKDRARFVQLARAKKNVEKNPFNAHQAILSLGEEDWPFPVPIASRKGKWLFDTEEGRLEILARRIGSNELDAMDVSRGFVEAQQEYASVDRDGNGFLEYAQRVISSPGKRDGLAWKEADGSWAGPVSQGVAKAVAEGHLSRTEPYHGYYYRVLKEQGPAAPTGRLNYVIKGAMIGGFALIAWPARYGVTGVQTFIINHDGILYQRDLGPGTSAIAESIRSFNPDSSWKPVKGN